MQPSPPGTADLAEHKGPSSSRAAQSPGGARATCGPCLSHRGLAVTANTHTLQEERKNQIHREQRGRATASSPAFRRAQNHLQELLRR